MSKELLKGVGGQYLSHFAYHLWGLTLTFRIQSVGVSAHDWYTM